MLYILVYVCALVLFFCIPSNEFLFNKLAKKIKGFFKETNSITSQFPQKSILEYPGSDGQLRSEITRIWEAYYDCLKNKLKFLGTLRTVTPEALMIFEGSSIRLDCKMCISPEQMENVDNIQWYFTAVPSQKLKEVEYGDQIFLSSEDKALHMYNLAQIHSGHYQCRFGRTVLAPYFLEVVNHSEPILKVKPDSVPKALHSIPAVYTPGEPYQVFTSWQPWSPCSTCGKAGKHVRFGMCTVKVLPKFKISDTQYTKNLSSIDEDYAIQKMGILKEAVQLLALFKNGIPCRSTLLPKMLKDSPEIKWRKSEMMTAFCKVPCTQTKLFEVLDDKGNVIEEANNSAGIYSALQSIPSAPPAVTRETIHEETGTFKIVIKCPGNINPDMPVQWQMQGKLLQAHLIERYSEGRIYIDEMNRINIKKPLVNDSNVYSCWQGGELIGAVTLEIATRRKLTFNHHIMLLSILTVCAVIILIFFRAFKGQEQVAAAVA